MQAGSGRRRQTPVYSLPGMLLWPRAKGGDAAMGAQRGAEGSNRCPKSETLRLLGFT